MTASSTRIGVRTREFEATSGSTNRSLSTSVRHGATWSLATTALLKISSIGVTTLTARILTQHDFGVFAVANAVFLIVSAIGELGVTSCIARADLRASDIIPTMWTVSLGTSLALAGTLVFFAEPIATALGSRDAAEPVRLMAFVVIFIGISSVPTAQCIRDFKQDKIFLASAISFVPATVVMLVLAKSGDGAMSFAWSRLAGQIVSCVVILLSVPKFYFPGLARGALSVLYRFGIPFATTNFISFLLRNVDYVIVGRMVGPTMLGNYVIAFNVASWSTSLLAGTLTTVSISAFSRVKHDPERLMSAIQDGLRTVMLIAAPMCTLEMVLARPLILTLYGPKWAAAIQPLVILTLYGLISIICTIFTQMLASLGNAVFILVIQIAWIVALVPAMAFESRMHGIVGAAMAHVFVIVPLVLPAYLFALRRSTRVRITKLARVSLSPIVMATIAAGSAWVVMSMLHRPIAQLLLGGAAGAFVYFVMTGPQIVLVISNRRIRHPVLLRAIRTYYHLGRSLGLRVGPPPRHAKRRTFR